MEIKSDHLGLSYDPAKLGRLLVRVFPIFFRFWKAVKGFYLSQGQTQKIGYVKAKSDHYKLSYEPAKLGRLLSHTYCLYYEYVTRF